MTSKTWTNEDGLQVPFGQDQARETGAIAGKIAMDGPVAYLVMDVNFDDFPDYTADLNNDGTLNGFSDSDAYIPAGSYIVSATLIIETLFAGGTDYDIGIYEQDGTAISAQGIDATLVLADIDGAADVVKCNGALAGGILSVGSDDAYIKFVEEGTFTAGKMKLVIAYVQVAP